MKELLCNFKKLPLLITRGTVLFPDQDIVLEVGREISVNNIHSSSEQYDNYILIVSQKVSSEDHPEADDIFHYGTLAKIVKLEKFEDSTYKVALKGLERVTLKIAKDQNLKRRYYFWN